MLAVSLITLVMVLSRVLFIGNLTMNMPKSSHGAQSFMIHYFS